MQEPNFYGNKKLTTLKIVKTSHLIFVMEGTLLIFMNPQKKAEITATGLKAGRQLLLLHIQQQIYGQRYIKKKRTSKCYLNFILSNL